MVSTTLMACIPFSLCKSLKQEGTLGENNVSYSVWAKNFFFSRRDFRV